jgi:hypothetical protein
LRFSRPCCSKSVREPKPRISSTPFFPILTCKIFQYCQCKRRKQSVNMDRCFYWHLTQVITYASAQTREWTKKTLGEVKLETWKNIVCCSFDDHLGSKERKVRDDIGLHIWALNNIWNSIQTFEASISKYGSSITARNMPMLYINYKKNSPMNHNPCITIKRYY